MLALHLGAMMSVAASATLSPNADRPQYICLNAIGGGQVPTQAMIATTLANLSGVQRSPDGRRLLCMAEQWSVLGARANLTAMAAQVDDFLALSVANDLPVSISVDATQWWESAEHIWNWWNVSRPSYNPANIRNVEWTGWDPEKDGVEISWRNWGSQFRMTAAPGFYVPPPNFAAPAFREAAAAAMLPLVGRIAAWYAGLPADKKYLLAYVRSTQELWQGSNFWYYKGGNSLIRKNATNDPKCGPGCAAQLGYAAACTTGGACAGELTLPALDAPINSYCDFANKLVLAAGIPRSRVMCHTGFGANSRRPPPPGKPQTPLRNTPATAVTNTGAPGWSMYIGSSLVHTVGGFELDAAFAAIDGAPWGAPEWMPFNLLAGKGNVAQWTAVFNDILGYKNNRLLIMQNWNSLWLSTPVSQAGITALSRVLATSPACLVDTATAMSAIKVNGTAWELRWTPGAGASPAESQRVLASAVTTLLPSGALAAPTLLDASVAAAATSATLTLIGDPSLELVQWQVLSRGCGGTQLATADVQSLVL